MLCPSCGEAFAPRAKFCWHCGRLFDRDLSGIEIRQSVAGLNKRQRSLEAVPRGDAAQSCANATDTDTSPNLDHRQLETLALRGDRTAQFELGRRCEIGDGIPQDLPKAVEWYRKSAEQGEAAAQVALGNLYERGQGVPADERVALKWYLKAAGQGYPGARLRYDHLDATNGRPSAQFIMGRRSEVGDGMPVDPAEAAKWYRLAAEQGYSSAQFRLGLMHHIGLGVDHNAAEAVRWLTKAAEAGDPRAQYGVGYLYETETSMLNHCAAFQWYRRSASQGYRDGQRRVADMLANGLGVAKNEVEAAKWQALAEREPPKDNVSAEIDEGWYGSPGWGGQR